MLLTQMLRTKFLRFLDFLHFGILTHMYTGHMLCLFESSIHLCMHPGGDWNNACCTFVPTEASWWCSDSVGMWGISDF